MRALLLAIALLLPAAARGATLYLGPAGNDAADGRSAHTALATLSTAIARAQQAAPGEDTRVIVLPGLYRGQHVEIDGRSLHGGLTIAGATDDPGGQRAIRDRLSCLTHHRAFCALNAAMATTWEGPQQ